MVATEGITLCVSGNDCYESGETTYYWDPQKSSVEKFVALGLGTAEEYSFSVLSNKLLGQSQPNQFQSFDDDQPLGWSWGSKVSDDGQYTTLSSVTNNINAEMPREYHGGNDSFGDLFNWYSATAESGKYNMLNTATSDSLCPYGWTLPSGDISESGSWYYLFTESYRLTVSTGDVGSDTDETKFLRTEPLSLSLSGYHHFTSSELISERNAYGLFWAARASSINAKEIAKKSVWIAMEYYEKNNVDAFFDNMSENVMWHGIAIGQKIQGLETIKQVWSTFSNSLTFSLGNIEAEYIQTSPKTCEVMMMYVVTVHYPNGDMVPAFQRAQFSWAEVSATDEEGQRKRVPKIFMVHISNPIEYHEDDYIYPDHYNELYIKADPPVQSPRISLLGTDSVFYVITLSSVIWIESTPEHQCILHLRDRTLRVRTNLSNLEKQTAGSLIRVHSSYIVNPLDVKAVWRFKVELSDGTVIPIPEKKYTAVKKKLIGASCQF